MLPPPCQIFHFSGLWDVAYCCKNICTLAKTYDVIDLFSCKGIENGEDIWCMLDLVSNYGERRCHVQAFISHTVHSTWHIHRYNLIKYLLSFPSINIVVFRLKYECGWSCCQNAWNWPMSTCYFRLCAMIFISCPTLNEDFLFTNIQFGKGKARNPQSLCPDSIAV